MAGLLKSQDREGGRDRRWRANFKKVQKELTLLEDDEYQLDMVFPQVGSARPPLGLAGLAGRPGEPPAASSLRAAPV
jgi:hypothetical protein